MTTIHHPIYTIPGGGPSHARIQQEIIITLELNSVLGAAHPRAVAQYEYLVQEIRKLLMSDGYKQGKLKAMWSCGKDGKIIDLMRGPTPSLTDYEQSFLDLKYGKIAPKLGHLSSMNYLHIWSKHFAYRSLSNTLPFGSAMLTFAFDVPDGSVRWFYDDIDISRANSTVTEG